MAHGVRCENARGPACSCSCGGTRHGGRQQVQMDKLFLSTCLWCKRPIYFEQGWRHIGGGVYVRYCKSCQHRWDNDDKAIECPQCGGPARDHHAALPSS